MLKYRILGRTPDVLDQNPHFHQIARRCVCSVRSLRSLLCVRAGSDVCSSVSLPENAQGWVCTVGSYPGDTVRGDYRRPGGMLRGLRSPSPCLPGPPPSDPASLFSSACGGHIAGLMGVLGILHTGPGGNLHLGEAIVWPCAPEVRGPGARTRWGYGLAHTPL